MLSVIIPTYNRARYIDKALDSLKNQNYTQEFEVVVIDDGSTDNTQQVVMSFANCLNLIYYKTNHQGVSAARNAGINQAKGEILVFFDDDAVARADWLQQIEQIMQAENIITGKVEPLTPNLWQYFAPHYDQGVRPITSTVLLEGNCAMRAEVFKQIGAFDTNLDYGHEGEEFIQRAEQKYDIKYYPEMVIYHDYAFGLNNYLNKQYKFGDKMVYLKRHQIKSVWHLIINYQRLKKSGVKSDHFKFKQPQGFDKLRVKLIAQLGGWSHWLGAIAGFTKYKDL